MAEDFAKPKIKPTRQVYLYDAGNDELFIYADYVELGYCVNRDANIPEGPSFADHAEAMLAGKDLDLPMWGEDAVTFGNLLAIYKNGEVEIVEEPHVCLERFDKYVTPRRRVQL